jgi:hypothetical protein
MKPAKWIGATLARVSFAVFAAFNTTQTSGSGKQYYDSATGTGAILGVGAALAPGKRSLSIGTSATTLAACRVQIWSSSVVNGTDTLAVLGSFSGYYAQGIDSLHVIANTSNITVEVGQ